MISNNDTYWLKAPNAKQLILLVTVLAGLTYLLIVHFTSYRYVIRMGYDLLSTHSYLELFIFPAAAMYGFIAFRHWDLSRTFGIGLILSVFASVLPPLVSLYTTLPYWQHVDRYGFAVIGLVLGIGQLYFVSVIEAILIGAVSFVGILMGVLTSRVVCQSQRNHKALPPPPLSSMPPGASGRGSPPAHPNA